MIDQRVHFECQVTINRLTHENERLRVALKAASALAAAHLARVEGLEKALKSAEHELVTLNGLHVTDRPDNCAMPKNVSWIIDTSHVLGFLAAQKPPASDWEAWCPLCQTWIDIDNGHFSSSPPGYELRIRRKLLLHPKDPNP